MTNEDQDPETMNDAEDKDETPKEEDDKDDGDEFNDPLGAKTKSKRSGQNGAQSDTSDPLTAAAAAARRETVRVHISAPNGFDRGELAGISNNATTNELKNS